jgi:mono/diheme cytochrome c family protein/glucose/arabinose dehydrogenase
MVLGSCSGQGAAPAPPTPQAGPGEAPVLTPAQALQSLRLPAGYHAELVASEPLVQDPVAVDFDADGRMYVVEMRGYMPNLEGTGEDVPKGRIVVLQDTNDDGKMDRKTVFLDSLVLPRSVKVLEHGVLVATTPELWYAKDTNGDLRADSKVRVRDDYGNLQSNPEHNANTPFWGIDNWIHNANYEGEFRLRDDHFEFRPTASIGQWGVTQDAYGRLYRNSNEDPLHADLVPAHYYKRNANQSRSRGVYEALTANVAVFPAHPTPAVNRGYMDGVLRPDSTLARFTSAGSPTVYVGDRLPHELVGNVFVTEPAGNLVHRFTVQETPDGGLKAVSAYEGEEFVASTDTRFRPVNVASAPDGTLYVVDMYRGIIQHKAYITPYLAGEIQAHGLEQPVGLGRIYRIVHDGTKRDRRPQLSKRSPAELVGFLSHPNGWWRMTAQRLLVERNAREVAPALRKLVAESPNELARLHALWTLDGLGEADVATVQHALADASAPVREAALRISEPRLAAGDAAMTAAVLRLADDPAPAVQRQLAASLGELPEGERVRALTALLERHGNDPVLADAAISGLQGHEFAVLQNLVTGAATGTLPDEAIAGLTMIVAKSGSPAEVSRMLGWAGNESGAPTLRLAVLQGLEQMLPRQRVGPGGARAGAAAGGRGAAGAAGAPGGRGGAPGAAAGAAAARGGAARGGGAGRSRTLEFKESPAGLIAAASSKNAEIRELASRLVDAADWPGKADDAPAGPALTPAEQARFAAGQKQFTATCAPCHQANGMGLPGVAKALVGSQWALGSPEAVVRIVLHGKEGEMLMPPIGSSLTDDQVAAVLTYVRNEWGNHASAIDPAQVQRIRAETASHGQAYTEAELAQFEK